MLVDKHHVAVKHTVRFYCFSGSLPLELWRDVSRSFVVDHVFVGWIGINFGNKNGIVGDLRFLYELG